MTLDDEIDALYELAPGEFTAARNALAKRAGARASEVRRLARPNAAAWAVNQLYWRRRQVFDALVRASEARRVAHVKQLGGKDADPALADGRHRAALEAALAIASTFLREAGDALSPATIAALTTTLEAVPSSEIQGRLSRPLESIGFSMLASLVGPGGLPSRAPAEVVVMKRAARAGDERAPLAPRARDSRAPAKPTADAARQERERLRKELSAARARELAAQQAHTRAKAVVDQAADRVRKLTTELDEARRALDERREAAEQARTLLNDATRERLVIERRAIEGG